MPTHMASAHLKPLQKFPVLALLGYLGHYFELKDEFVPYTNMTDLETPFTKYSTDHLLF